MTTKKPAPEKRIPAGTTVKFRARYSSDPLWEGEVVAFYAGARACYKVKATKRDGKELGTRGGKPVFLTPYASRLEAQNPTKLKKV